MPKHEVYSTIPERSNGKRKLQVLMSRIEGQHKMTLHVRATHDRATGEPDGGTESAFTDVGVCTECGLTRQDVTDTDAGKKCSRRRLILGGVKLSEGLLSLSQLIQGEAFFHDDESTAAQAGVAVPR